MMSTTVATPAEPVTRSRNQRKPESLPILPACFFLAGLSFALSFSSLAQGSDSILVMHFGGDVLLAGHYETAAEEDPALGFRDFELFHSADVALVNLECPVTTRGEAVPKPYNFRIHPKFLGPLKDAGITVLNLANNHMFDYGEIGFFDTIANIDSLGLGRIGAGRNREEAHRGFLFEKAGKKGRTPGLLPGWGGPGCHRQQRRGGLAEAPARQA